MAIPAVKDGLNDNDQVNTFYDPRYADVDIIYAQLAFFWVSALGW